MGDRTGARQQLLSNVKDAANSFGETALSNIILYPSIVRSGNTFYGVGLPLLGSGVCSLLIWSELLEFMMHSDHSPAHSTSEQMHGPVCKTKNVVQWKKSVLKVTVFFFVFFSFKQG